MMCKTTLAIVLALFTSAIAHAQTSQASPPSAEVRTRPSAEAIQAAREMMAAAQIDRQIDMMTETMVGPMIDAQVRRYRNVTADQRNAFAAATMDGMRAVMPRYLESVVEIYAGAFTVAELRAIRDFYLSPIGQTMLQRQPLLSVGATNAMLPLLPIIEQEIRDSLCRRLNCGDLQPSSVS